MAATGRTGTLCPHPAARATSKEQVHTALAAKEAIAVKTPAGRKCSRILERPQHGVRACGKSVYKWREKTICPNELRSTTLSNSPVAAVFLVSNSCLVFARLLDAIYD